MSIRPARTIVMLPSTTLTTTGTGSAVINIEGYTAVILRLTSTTVTGTSPTLNMRIQQGVKDDNGATAAGEQPPAGATTTWNDYAAFTQQTAAAVHYIRIVAGGSVAGAASAGAQAAGTTADGPLGSVWRVQYTLGGTNPSFAGVDVVAQLIP